MVVTLAVAAEMLKAEAITSYQLRRGPDTIATTLGLLHLQLRIVQAQSLKDKRRVVKGFKDRLANGFNVSVAEVDRLDDRRSAVLAVAMVANDKRYVESQLQKIINTAAEHRDMNLVDYELQWL